MKLFAEDVLRGKYKLNPPLGYSVKQIEKMSAEDLLDLDYSEQMRRTAIDDNDPFEEKYTKYA